MKTRVMGVPLLPSPAAFFEKHAQTGCWEPNLPHWIFKILRDDEWVAAQETKVFAGAPIDEQDGYIHFSTWHQLRETAQRHFADAVSIHVIAFNANLWNDTTLKWEVSRGGDLFPHLYTPLDVSLAANHWHLLTANDGTRDFSDIESWLEND